VPNINDFNRLYRRTIKEKANGTDPIRLELEKVPPRVLRVLSHVTVENKGDAYDICRLGIQTAARRHYLDELLLVAADELAVSRSDIILGEGDVFFAELTGADAPGELVMTCVGWEQDLK